MTDDKWDAEQKLTQQIIALSTRLFTLQAKRTDKKNQERGSEHDFDEVINRYSAIGNLWEDTNSTHVTGEQLEEDEVKLTDGSIRKKADGRWETRLSVNGKMITTACGRNKAKCLELHRKKVNLKKQGKLQRELAKQADKKHCPKLHAWVDQCIELYKKPPTVVEHTYKNALSVAKRIKNGLADKPVKDYTTEELQKFLNGLPSDRAREDVGQLLSLAFRKAKRKLPENPMDDVEVKAAKRGEGRALTREQQKEFLKLADGSELKWLYRTYLNTGARVSELLRFNWDHIDYDNSSVFLPGTKTENSPRYIPLFPTLQEIFSHVPRAGACRQRNKKLSDGRVFPISLSVLKRDFTAIKQKLEFDMSLKDLRTTFATRCKENGIEDRIIQKWMGHADIKTTTKIYIKVLGEFEQSQAAKFAPYFAPHFGGKSDQSQPASPKNTPQGPEKPNDETPEKP